MKSLCLLIKPSSDNCNMRCKYCFYEDIAQKHCEKLGFMNSETAENLIKKAFSFAEREITFMFQGGEPTLIGLDFYRSFVDCVKKHNKNSLKINYAIQTNGYVVNDEWADFFKNHGFLVGLSLDATKELHDLCRVDASGKGTFTRVTEAAKTLEKHGVDFNILTVVTNAVARSGQAVYNEYKKRGYRYLQFIPCLNPIDAPNEKFDFTLTPERYGRFLNVIFDLWVRDIRSNDPVSIRQFENYVMMLRGMPPESCGFSGVCSFQYVVEADGSVYPCDFYVLDELKLGNVNENTFEDLDRRREETGFVERSREKPEECSCCEYFPICRNGCKRYCEPLDENGVPGKNRFCESYRMFFEHSLGTLFRLSQY